MYVWPLVNVVGQRQECCICLSTYEDGAELRELPCSHHFHCACVDKWLHLHATCPLCKFDILKTANHQEVWTVQFLVDVLTWWYCLFPLFHVIDVVYSLLNHVKETMLLWLYKWCLPCISTKLPYVSRDIHFVGRNVTIDTTKPYITQNMRNVTIDTTKPYKRRSDSIFLLVRIKIIEQSSKTNRTIITRLSVTSNKRRSNSWKEQSL